MKPSALTMSLIAIAASAAFGAGCSKDSEASVSTAKGGAAPVVADGGNYKLDYAVPAAGCTASSECAVAVKLSALAEYHINDNYPYKLRADAVDGVTFLGKTDANLFSKSNGDFEKQAEKVAVMNVRFKPSAKGKLTVTGKFKLSVCSDGNCVLDEAPVSYDVDVR